MTLSTRDAIRASIYPPITSHYSVGSRVTLASHSHPHYTYHHSSLNSLIPSLSFLVRLPYHPSTRHSIGPSGCPIVGPRTGANLPPSEPGIFVTNFDRALRGLPSSPARKNVMLIIKSMDVDTASHTRTCPYPSTSPSTSPDASCSPPASLPSIHGGIYLF